MKPVYVTGNPHKARLFNQMVNMELDHEKANIDELQSLDLLEIVEHKAKSAYELLKRPVIVEDTQLMFHAMGKLPGPLIKWFLEELGADKLCKILDPFEDRHATAGAAIAYYDGRSLQIFESSLGGEISNGPRGDSGFGWNVIFIPEGSDKTFGELEEKEFIKYYKKVKPFDQLASYLRSIDKA